MITNNVFPLFIWLVDMFVLQLMSYKAVLTSGVHLTKWLDKRNRKKY